tara:strand:+ start:21 stop:932 length:912 start_codon:yes stop_codon:yes gene_type:complete
MRIGIASGTYCTQILAAVLRRPQVDAEIISSKGTHRGYDIVLAVNDEPVPPGNDVRRYVTELTPEVSEWTVVAARHLLPIAVERGVETPIAVPMPIEFPGSDLPSRSGVLVLQSESQHQVTAKLRSAGIEVFLQDDCQVGIIVDAAASTSRVEPLRQAMAKEKVVTALSTNAAATDTIRHDTNGYLVNDLDEIVSSVQQIVEDESERSRLGFEARKSVASANWSRVVRALLLEGRAGMPQLETFSHLPAIARWQQRLGHAHPWSSLSYNEHGYFELDDQHLQIGQLGELRQWSLSNVTAPRDQ